MPETLRPRVLVVGGGMSGIMTASRLIRNGVTNIRLLERGGDFGGGGRMAMANQATARAPQLLQRPRDNSPVAQHGTAGCRDG